MSAPRRSADRRLRRGAAIVALAAVLLPAAAGADPRLRVSPQVAELERGLFCAVHEGSRLDAPDTEFGWVHIPEDPVDMRRPGTVVPAVLGMGFGLEYTFAGNEPFLIRHVIEHPPMPPSGRVQQSWEGWVVGGIAEVVFFQFDIEAELLPGRWSFTALKGADELFHVGFDVVAPGAAPHLAGLCDARELLTLNR